VNVSEWTTVEVALPRAAARGAVAYRVTAPALSARQARLNDAPLIAAEDGEPPDVNALGVPVEEGGTLTLPPASLAFVMLPDAGATACH